MVVPTRKRRLEAGMKGMTVSPKPRINAGHLELTRKLWAANDVAAKYAVRTKSNRTSLKACSMGNAS